MKKAFQSLLIMLLVTPVFGQNEIPTQTSPGSNAFLFQIDPNFRLSSLGDYLFSFKRHLNEKKAWRIGVSLAGSFSRAHVSNDTIGIYGPDGDYRTGDASASLSYQNYFHLQKPLSAYYGYGAHVRFSGSRYSASSGYNNRIFLGPLFYAGAEWFFNDYLSLSGEFGCRASYGYDKSKYNGVTRTEHSLSFRQDQVRLGLAAYFK